MDFKVAPAHWTPTEQEQVPALLHRAFVEAGFADPERARLIFAPEALRQRGALLLARAQGQVIGMIMVVRPESPARQVAQDYEAELHLLAVAPETRGQGVGDALICAAEAQAGAMGFAALVLSTQSVMTAAQRCYARNGYQRNPARDWAVAGRSFWVYEKRGAGDSP